MDVQRRKSLRTLAGVALAAGGLATATRLGAAPRALAQSGARADRARLMWIDHLALLPGDPSVRTSFNAVSSGVGRGLAGLVIESTTTGDVATGGGNKVVETAVGAPPGFLVAGVRLGYELSGTSYISQIRLAQVQDPPSTALVLLEDGTPRTAPGPLFVDSAPATVDPERGPILLSLRLAFKSSADRIVVRGLGLYLRPVR